MRIKSQLTLMLLSYVLFFPVVSCLYGHFGCVKRDKPLMTIQSLTQYQIENIHKIGVISLFGDELTTIHAGTIAAGGGFGIGKKTKHYEVTNWNIDRNLVNALSAELQRCGYQYIELKFDYKKLFKASEGNLVENIKTKKLQRLEPFLSDLSKEYDIDSFLIINRAGRQDWIVKNRINLVGYGIYRLGTEATMIYGACDIMIVDAKTKELIIRNSFYRHEFIPNTNWSDNFNELPQKSMNFMEQKFNHFLQTQVIRKLKQTGLLS